MADGDDERIVFTSTASIDLVVEGAIEAIKATHEGETGIELTIGVYLMGEMAKRMWKMEHASEN